MKEFWNKRFSEEKYIYGKEPNEFFKKELDKLKVGKLLLPAEGEGRNAVYAASKGWGVTAFDYSEEAKQKAFDLANENNVDIAYLVSDYDSVSFPKDYFDAVALIYAHTPEWKNVYPRILGYLKPGGVLIIELFNKKQINNASGGPKDTDMLVNADELEINLAGISQVKAWDETIELAEGDYHLGKADVVRCIGIK